MALLAAVALDLLVNEVDDVGHGPDGAGLRLGGDQVGLRLVEQVVGDLHRVERLLQRVKHRRLDGLELHPVQLEHRVGVHLHHPLEALRVNAGLALLLLEQGGLLPVQQLAFTQAQHGEKQFHQLVHLFLAALATALAATF